QAEDGIRDFHVTGVQTCALPIYAQLSRGKFEMAAIEALASAVLDLRRLAWDLSLFTSAEFGFVALPAQYTTGSSIMPHKRNPDRSEERRVGKEQSSPVLQYVQQR